MPEEAAMNHDHYADSYIRHILKPVHTIAVLGASPHDGRPSHGVMGADTKALEPRHSVICRSVSFRRDQTALMSPPSLAI